MISQQEMLDIIATEAIEGPDWKHPIMPERRDDQDQPTVRLDLRLVRKHDGTYEWKD